MLIDFDYVSLVLVQDVGVSLINRVQFSIAHMLFEWSPYRTIPAQVYGIAYRDIALFRNADDKVNIIRWMK